MAISTQTNLLAQSARLMRRFLGKTQTEAWAPEEALRPMQEPFQSALLSMYRNEAQEGVDGHLHVVDPSSRIPPSQGMWLYNHCLEERPESVLEIGTCYGYSALFLLAALTKNSHGQLTSIDPYERAMWHGIALRTIEKLGAGERFRHIQDRSDRVATDLIREGKSFELIFIDGSHHFDDVLADFYLYAQLCAEDGRIIFDDMWMPSVESAVAFVRANRPDFREVQSLERNIAVFRKSGGDTRTWDHFRPFSVSARSSGNP